jgi:hypothetical protein
MRALLVVGLVTVLIGCGAPPSEGGEEIIAGDEKADETVGSKYYRVRVLALETDNQGDLFFDTDPAVCLGDYACSAACWYEPSCAPTPEDGRIFARTEKWYSVSFTNGSGPEASFTGAQLREGLTLRVVDADDGYNDSLGHYAFKATETGRQDFGTVGHVKKVSVQILPYEAIVVDQQK